MFQEKDSSAKRTVAFFSISAFLNDLGYYMVSTIWPIFVTQVIGASVVFLGFVDGLGDALVSISQAASGLLSDKIKKRKVFIWVGYFFAFLSRIIFGASRTPWHLAAGKILDRSGKMRDASRDAIMADITAHEKRAMAFGVLRASDRAGAVVGILAATFLVSILSFRSLFFLAAVPPLIGTVIILLFVREKKDGADGLALKFSLKLAGRDLKIFSALSVIFTLGAFSDSFYILATRQLGFSLSLTTFFYFIFLLFSSLAAIPFGKLADKIGRKKVLAIAYVFFIILNSLFIILITNPSFLGLTAFFWLFVAFLIYGLHYGAYEGNLKTIVAELSPRPLRASFIGSFQMFIGLTALPASFLAGVLWKSIGFAAPFIFSTILAAAALITLFFVKEPAKI